MKLTTEQKQALAALQQFIRTSGTRVFVLNGQAGTGKTTMVKAIVKWLADNKYTPVLLATTGRAAKVLADKTEGEARTLHSHIYTFDDIRGSDTSGQDAWESSTGQLILDFGIRDNLFKSISHVYIVDEASMISHEISEDTHTAKFGTGSLLDDFMAFTNPNKVLFVGDSCQLPPVSTTPFSGALDTSFLSSRYGIRCTSFTLREILRQQADHEILRMAADFRRGIERDAFVKYPKLVVNRNRPQQTKLHTDEAALLNAYVQAVRKNGFNRQVMLSNSNWKCQELNRRVRTSLQKSGILEEGDLLMVVQNSYVVPLVNGDQVEVLSVLEYGHRAGLHFLKVEVKTVHSGVIYPTLLIADLLQNDQPSLTPNAFKALMIDFDQRMRNLGIRRKSEAYVNAMMSDPYLNALRAKYGYAITCHKAQGGEWPEVFLLIHKSIFGMRGASLYRWFYTALTRAKEKLHLHQDWWVVQQ